MQMSLFEKTVRFVRSEQKATLIINVFKELGYLLKLI